MCQLSNYFKQNATESSFKSNDSWVILTNIEKRIKDKIEAVGTPLKDWDIYIYRGVLTGFNEAFIISGAKKEEILANCKSEDERIRTDELIRPILRGRDIKRYSYDFTDLYLIATFPSMEYNINDFPAVKDFLIGFKPKLKQTGEKITKEEKGRILAHALKHGINLNDNSLKTSRKKTSNKWFETQDSIGYWGDFSKHKIVYPNMTKYMPFYLDNESFYTNQKCFILTGEKLYYLTAFFNSNIFKICYRENFPELQGGTRELSKIFFEELRIPKLEDKNSYDFNFLVNNVQNGNEHAVLKLEKTLIFALELQEYEEYILNYCI